MGLPAVRTHKIMIKRLVVLNKLRGVLQLALLLMPAMLFVGCGKGGALDYAKPKAQFLAKDVAVKGKAYVGDKVIVKGNVTKVDVSDPSSAKIYLEDGIECNLGKFKAMATSCKVGDTVFVDGFLERCQEGDILLQPAMLRDPTAAFVSQ